MIAVLLELDPLGRGLHFVVVLLRVIGLFIFLPIFGSGLMPPRVRFTLATITAVALMPLVPQLPAAPTQPVGWLPVVAHELAVGFGLGVAARMMFSGVEAAAALVAGQSGFALASMVDPISGDQALAPSLFQNLLTTALMLAADLHHVFLRAVLGSYELLPPAAEFPSFRGFDETAVLLGSRLFVVAVELAAPALIVTVAVDLVMVLVGKAMPQVPILIVGYPLKMAVGLIAMAMLATGTGSAVGWIGRTMAQDGAAIVSTLSGK